MTGTRIRKALLVLMCGGMLLQSACVQGYILPLAANIAGAVAFEVVLNALGLSGSAVAAG